ncbi:NAD(P)/FAD-dependent oxidoreductase [Ruania albidiflava]|uniref:NAD(P)/FAD-dependent oxidoreductase n=1 Tax=Ruania albidiflava TaxID=366586 RepID=UPI0003B6BA91|nr:FAD/NAD(P)-binding oxidoreductase [Ruania albidiflava]
MTAKLQVVVLGAGFGGLEVARTLSETLGEQVQTTLVDRAESFVFGFSKLDFMFGHTDADHVRLPYANVRGPGLQVLRAEVRAIDPHTRTVTLDDDRQLHADLLVVALGADLDPAATPGLEAAGQEFYTVAGAEAARDALESFDGGRLLIAVTSTPFKCPPAPSEAALLAHDFLTQRGLRAGSSIDLVMPLPTPVPPAPAASEAILAAFAERGIGWHPKQQVQRVDPEARSIVLTDGSRLDFDLLLAVPAHRAPQVVVDAGLTEDGWIPVDARTLCTRYPGVFAIGDVTSVGTPKAGAFAEGQGQTVAAQIIDQVRGGTSADGYGGHGACLMEFGGGQVAKVEVTFAPGEAPYGRLVPPSLENATEKQSSGTRRAQRWFGQDWRPLPARS